MQFGPCVCSLAAIKLGTLSSHRDWRQSPPPVMARTNSTFFLTALSFLRQVLSRPSREEDSEESGQSLAMERIFVTCPSPIVTFSAFNMHFAQRPPTALTCFRIQHVTPFLPKGVAAHVSFSAFPLIWTSSNSSFIMTHSACHRLQEVSRDHPI